MAKHKRRLKVNKLLMPTAVILVVLVFVIAAAMYGFNTPPARSKAPASEYFSVHAVVLPEYGVEEHNQTNGKYYIIYAMGFNITAVKGNANGVTIYWANAYSDEVNIRQGQSAWVQIISTYGTPVGPVTGSTFQTEIRVASEEAEGKVTITVS